MKSITISDIPENKYGFVIELLKSLNLNISQNDTSYEISNEEKKFIDIRLKQYLENPADVTDIDTFIKTLEKKYGV